MKFRVLLQGKVHMWKLLLARIIIKSVQRDWLVFKYNLPFTNCYFQSLLLSYMLDGPTSFLATARTLNEFNKYGYAYLHSRRSLLKQSLKFKQSRWTSDVHRLNLWASQMRCTRGRELIKLTTALTSWKNFSPMLTATWGFKIKTGYGQICVE